MQYITLILIAFVIDLLIIFLSKHMHIGLDLASKAKPQRMHHVSTPRIGGIGIFLAFGVGVYSFGWILLGLFVIFLGGLLEDFYDFIKPIYRLCIQILGIGLMLFSGHGLISDLSPILTLSFYASIVFSIFGICGVCNALNIIDGLNGLSSGIAMLVLGAIFYLSDGAISQIALIALCASFGFFMLNFPLGKIFLGDGGAYFLGALIGFLLAWMSNEGFSAWLGLALMIYPVWEVVFSIIRRKLKGAKAMQPDSLHLHSLLFSIMGNAKASLCLLLLYGIYLVLVVSLSSSPLGYMIASMIFVLCYCVFYYFLTSRLPQNSA